jgi:hypothetical protein
MEPTITGQEAALAQTMGTGILIFVLALMAFYIITLWRIFTKAGQPGWAVLIPIYSAIVYLKIIGRSGAWLLVYLFLGMLYGVGAYLAVTGNAAAGGLLVIVGLIGILVISIIDTHRLSKSFSQGAGFTVGLVLINIVFYALLAFGDYKYVGPNGDGPAQDSNPEVLHS